MAARFALGVFLKLVDVHCESQSVIELVKNQVYYSRMKHIDVRFPFIREILNEMIFF